MSTANDTEKQTRFNGPVPPVVESVDDAIDLESYRMVQDPGRFVEEYLWRLDLRVNKLLVLEVLVSILILNTIHTFVYFASSVDRSAISACGDDGMLCTNGSGLCLLTGSLSKELLRSSYMLEFGLFCGNENESADVYGLGLALGALVGGLIADIGDRHLSFYLGLWTLNLALITLTACTTVSIFTVATFILGFAGAQCLVSITVTVIELLPFYLHLPFLIAVKLLRSISVYIGYLIRILFPLSWRVFGVVCWIFSLSLLSLVYHLPHSPRHKVERNLKRACTTLSRLGIHVPESESEAVTRERSMSSSSGVLDYKSNRKFLVTLLLLCSLCAIVSVTTTPTSGQVWQLVFDRNERYVIEVSVYLASIPLLAYIAHKDLPTKLSMLTIGWVSTTLYFLGQIPIGTGLFILRNVCGAILVPLVQTLRTLVLLLFLQMLPTCYRATSYGIFCFTDLSFLRLGTIIGEDMQPTPTHNYSFLLFGVFYLAFVYLASFLPGHPGQTLPNTLIEFNDAMRLARGYSDPETIRLVARRRTPT